MCSKIEGPILAAILAGHVALLAWAAVVDSPVWDEPRHMIAGIRTWQHGRFDMERVNPPLPRLVATIPVLLARPATDWSGYRDGPGERPEVHVRGDFILANGSRIFWLHTLGRWATIPFSLLGAAVCHRWARDLYGWSGGLLAVWLWCFCPNILGHGHLMLADVPATAMAAAAAYAFWRWLRNPSGLSAFAAGLILGLAQLTKATLLVLIPIWLVLCIVWPTDAVTGGGRQRAGEATGATSSETAHRRTQLLSIFVIALYVMNLGYAFEGSFTRLRDFQFVSRVLAAGEAPGNRFAGHWLGDVPLPLPAEYIRGIDRQRLDFDRKLCSYLRGEWRRGGWWYYYLYALAVKVPHGTLILLAAACTGLVRQTRSLCWADDLALLLPALAIFALVSSQTGFSHHMKYVLPAFPFLFIWAGRAGAAFRSRSIVGKSMVAVCLVWSTGSSLWAYPHSLSYFNELAGGPRRGHAHLLDSNIDWGQDLLHLERWLQRHPSDQPLWIAYRLPFLDPQIAGIAHHGRPPLEPRPGRFALSVSELRSQCGTHRDFLNLESAGMAGYSIYIYDVSLRDANNLRLKRGLPEYEEN